MQLNQLLKNNLVSIAKISKQYEVKQLFVFGSITRNDFRENSDIDFLVEFNNFESNHFVDNFFNFKYELEQLLNRKVDLIEIDSIHNTYLLSNINENKVLLYATWS